MYVIIDCLSVDLWDEECFGPMSMYPMDEIIDMGSKFLCI